MGKVGGNHPGNVGGERASSKNSKDAGARGRDKDRAGLGRTVTGSTVGGMGVDSAGYGFNREDLKTGNYANPDVAANAKSLQDKLNKQGVNQTNLTTAERQRFAKSLHAMQQGYTDSLDDGMGGFFSGLTPFDERNPYSDPDYGFGQIDANTGQLQQDANWSFDIGEVLSALAGGAFGVPLTGQVYSGLKKFGVIPEDFATVGLGSSVFGKPSGPVTAANPQATTQTQGFDTTPAPAQKSLSPFNNRIGGYSGGGYNMGAFGKKPTKKTGYLTQQLMAP